MPFSSSIPSRNSKPHQFLSNMSDLKKKTKFITKMRPKKIHLIKDLIHSHVAF